MFQLATCCHSEQWNVRHFGATSCRNSNGITATSFRTCSFPHTVPHGAQFGCENHAVLSIPTEQRLKHSVGNTATLWSPILWAKNGASLRVHRDEERRACQRGTWRRREAEDGRQCGTVTANDSSYKRWPLELIARAWRTELKVTEERGRRKKDIRDNKALSADYGATADR